MHKGTTAFFPRLVAGLLYLLHPYDYSDEESVITSMENPSFQYFICETYFQTESTMDSSSLTHWGKRMMKMV